MNHDPTLASHMALSAIGEKGQQRISAAHVAIVGLGGLGCPAALYLAAAGVGRLTLCDFDRVAAGNLNRQILYGESDIGELKTVAAARALRRQRPALDLRERPLRVGPGEAAELAADADLILDASDNFPTRLNINRACLESRSPWVMGAAVRLEGQLMTFRPDLAGQPCYRCVYLDSPDQLEDCAGAGVFGPVTGAIGCAMAAQALLLLAGQEPDSCFKVLDARTWEWQGLRARRNDKCEVCSNG